MWSGEIYCGALPDEDCDGDGRRKSTWKQMQQFWVEAQELRKGLVLPSFKEVFRLTILAIVFILISMVALAAMDQLFYKLIGERFVKKWAASQAKAGVAK